MATSYVDISARLMLNIKNILQLKSERNIPQLNNRRFIHVPRALCTVVFGRLLQATILQCLCWRNNALIDFLLILRHLENFQRLATSRRKQNLYRKQTISPKFATVTLCMQIRDWLFFIREFSLVQVWSRIIRFVTIFKTLTIATVQLGGHFSVITIK